MFFLTFLIDYRTILYYNRPFFVYTFYCEFIDKMTFSDDKDCPKIEKQLLSIAKGNHQF